MDKRIGFISKTDFLRIRVSIHRPASFTNGKYPNGMHLNKKINEFNYQYTNLQSWIGELMAIAKSRHPPLHKPNKYDHFL